MRKRRQRWLEEQARKAEQQKIWDSKVKAQQDWNNKPKAERIADARYVLRWSIPLARAVVNGTIWITEAIQMCKKD